MGTLETSKPGTVAAGLILELEMPNNNALFNAVIAGITGGVEARWLTKQNASDYTAFKNTCLVIATLIDSKIESIADISPGAIRMMQSICQGVFSKRYPQSLVESDYNPIANAIVALWSSSTESIDVRETPPGFSFSPTSWEIWDDFHNPTAGTGTTTGNGSGGVGDTNWNYQNSGSAASITSSTNTMLQIEGMIEQDSPSGAGITRLFRTQPSSNTMLFRYFKRFRMNVSLRAGMGNENRRCRIGITQSFAQGNPFPATDFFFFWFEPTILGNTNWHVTSRGDSGTIVTVDTGIQANKGDSGGSTTYFELLDIQQTEVGVWVASLYDSNLVIPDYQQTFITDVPNPDSPCGLGTEVNHNNSGTSSTVHIDWANIKFSGMPRLGQIGS